MRWFEPTEREKWATPARSVQTRSAIGLPALDARTRYLYEMALPRNVPVARFAPDRPPVNFWMSPQELAQHRWRPGQLILGKFAGGLLGYLDDRPMVTIAGSRSGKTSTILEPNLYTYPGSALILDPKVELVAAAPLRRALGHDVHVLDPFGRSGMPSACFNVLDELDPASPTIIDDVGLITHALIMDDPDSKSRHWNDSARQLLRGIILLTLLMPEADRHLGTLRELLCLSYPPLVHALKVKMRRTGNGKMGESFLADNSIAMELMLKTMVQAGDRFGGILSNIGNRFLSMPPGERGSVFSTAAAQTDFLDSLALRAISKRSDFRLGSLRTGRTSIFVCLPIGRVEHYRWLRLILQMACLVLEQFGAYPRGAPPILFLIEEFAALGHMDMMEGAAAYFPGFGVKLWAILQDATQLQSHYQRSWETFLGNAGLVQCFANGDQTTLEFLARRMHDLAAPFELRTAFARRNFSQLLLFEGERPAAATRLEHDDVAMIRAHARRGPFEPFKTIPGRTI